MRLPQLRERFDQKCEFPVETERVAALFDDTIIDAPNGESVELTTVLERTDETTHRSLDDLHDTVLANLDDRHVGRKHYDDRSRTHTREDELSF